MTRIIQSKVSYYETDCMNIVHHSNYIRYFEDARIQYMHDIGCDVAEMQSKGLYIPNVDAYARYKKPLKFGDEFSVEVSLVFFTGSRMIFDYKIFNNKKRRTFCNRQNNTLLCNSRAKADKHKAFKSRLLQSAS